MSSIPPGWYDDGAGAWRWWDGSAWTNHTNPPSPPVAVPAPAASVGTAPESDEVAAAPRNPNVPRWVIPVVVAAAAVVLLAAVLGAVLLIAGAVRSIPAAEPAPVLQTELPSDDAVAAIDAVLDYHDAALAADCERFLFLTTVRFREEAWNFSNCAEFESVAAAFAEGVRDPALEVVDVRGGGPDLVYVSTDEQYVSTRSEDDGTVHVDHYRYAVLDAGGRWVVDAIIDDAGTQ